MVELYSLWNIEKTIISVNCLQSSIKGIGNNGKDTGKMGVTSKEKSVFSEKT